MLLLDLGMDWIAVLFNYSTSHQSVFFKSLKAQAQTHVFLLFIFFLFSQVEEG
jgi:hypothetical protein